jgi:uracil-DNA glycosylase
MVLRGLFFTVSSINLKTISDLQRLIRKCRACPNVVGPPVHGAAIYSEVFLLGQAPGPREAHYGKPFAYTAGRTLFRWFNEVSGIDEETFRDKIYMAAVARCYPGKGKSSGDRVPDANEISNCSKHLEAELEVLQPKLILAIGKLAISQALGPEKFGKNQKLVDVVGKSFRVTYHGHETDVICLPHPSGLSAWHKVEPGKTLLKKALKLVVTHPAWQASVE